ncbi:hypothetical protein OS242_10365 [Tumebacillus sp. DT12]|uniref:Uncharacterized protein n=1 Tax=Tumebacillus lacus TaxID=2995335 RepID=A0ABT3X3G8_9BACL|nr:hypothetical protein [Tumebacillus lacus]MCX7570367.1 hypothetical protein [Tumebacillus lacus]
MARQMNPAQVTLFHRLNHAFRTMGLKTPKEWQAVIKESVGLNPDGTNKLLSRLTADEMRKVLTDIGIDSEATAS